MDDVAFPAGPLAVAFGLETLDDAILLPAGKSRHWRVRSPAGDWVARCSYRSKTADQMAFEHALMAHVAVALPVPEIRTTSDGRTWAEIGDRLWRLSRFVAAEPFRAGHLPHVDALAAALAAYHAAVRSFRLRPPAATPPVWEVVADRLAGLPDTDPGSADLRHLLTRAAEVVAGLRSLAPELPRTIVHGGCRRGSALFHGDRLAALLDFDSARPDARVLDVAVAVHDLTKVYGDPADADHKVPLDLTLADRFLTAYRDAGGHLTAAELGALPLLLAAKRCNRALGRYRRLVAGEALSEGDRRKIALESARVRWLADHREDLGSVLAALVPSA